MPHRGGDRTMDEWNGTFRPSYDALKACCDNPDSCNPEEAVIPEFWGEQDDPPTNKNQKIIPPDPQLRWSAGKANCIFDDLQGETCDIVAAWEDPSDEYNAPSKDDWYWEIVISPKPVVADEFRTEPHCPNKIKPSYVKGYPEKIRNAPDAWRHRYYAASTRPGSPLRHAKPSGHSNSASSSGGIPPCSVAEIRVCDGHCKKPHESIATGLVARVETACQRGSNSPVTPRPDAGTEPEGGTTPGLSPSGGTTPNHDIPDAGQEPR